MNSLQSRPMVETITDLCIFFKNHPTDRIMVSEELRKQCLISPLQGNVCVGGKTEKIWFEYIDGGVWLAFLSKPNTLKKKDKFKHLNG